MFFEFNQSNIDNVRHGCKSVQGRLMASATDPEGYLECPGWTRKARAKASVCDEQCWERDDVSQDQFFYLLVDKRFLHQWYTFLSFSLKRLDTFTMCCMCKYGCFLCHYYLCLTHKLWLLTISFWDVFSLLVLLFLGLWTKTFKYIHSYIQ